MKRLMILALLVFLLCSITVLAFASIVSIPEDTTTICEYAFYGDVSITEIDLPEGLLRIEEKAFAYTSLTTVLLPSTLQYFSSDAFEGCPADFFVRVFPGSEAKNLCEAYHIPYTIEGSKKVGISMPTKDLYRWNQDGENMRKLLEEAGCTVDLQFASNDVQQQLNQLTDMINNGCEVIVIAAIEGSSLGSALDFAKEKGIPIIAYDRLLQNSDAVSFYITFDNYEVGVIQGIYVKDKLDLDNAVGPFYLEITAGDPGDNNARYFYQGAIDVLMPYIESGKLIVKSAQVDFNDVATPAWRTKAAQSRADAILVSFYADGSSIDAWLCSNDSTALGIINSLEENYAGEWPIITGQDCDFSNVKRIIQGKQSMSVFKDTSIMVTQATKMVRQILLGEAVEINDTETYYNNAIVVPAFLCAPVYVDADNYVSLLIETGYYSEEYFF